MATANDWDTRKARVLDQFSTQLPALITNYEMKTRALDDIQNQVSKLEDEKGKLEFEINKAEQEAATADREFIEKKETFPDPFKVNKLYTIQDFTFFLFFLSYVIFLVAMAMVLEDKTKVLGIGLVVLFILVILMYRYI
jgi:hypothetical protein